METAASVHRTFELRERVAIVTGAAGGIGRSTAEVLAGAGATVYCADIAEPGAEETASAIRDGGGAAVAHRLDVADRSAHGELVQRVLAEHGRLDVLCNVAGMMVDSTILDLREEDLDAIVAVNLKGVLFGCQAAGRAMVERGSGSIVNMASAAVLTPAEGIGPYAVTKSGVLQITRTMAVEVGPRGVRVNAVAPGFVPTDMTARYYRKADGTIDEELKAAVVKPMARAAPLRRVGVPTDIAYTMLYLASDASSFVTGQLLSPNGGVAMH